MTKKLIIAGAGMAGLLAANLLHRRSPIVEELQPFLPNNHSAVLRFRTPSVGDALGIPFRPVTMIKGVASWQNPIADALAYSYKCSGIRRSDRSINDGQVAATRYIAPPDLVQRMASPLGDALALGRACAFLSVPGHSFISTMPMPSLMEMLDYPGRKAINFSSMPGVNIKCKVARTDAYVSLLVPDPAHVFARLSLMGDELTVECPGMGQAPSAAMASGLACAAASMLGYQAREVTNVSVHAQKYAKILPIPDEQRKPFIYWASNHYSIYSLGRFATWRPGVLMDDLINDIRRIDGWLSNPIGHYERFKA